MADYTTVAMGVRSLVDDILRTDVPPAGAVSWAIPDGQGRFIEIPLADLGGDTSQEAEAITYNDLLAELNAVGVVRQRWFRITDRPNSTYHATVYFTDRADPNGFGSEAGNGNPRWGNYNFFADAFSYADSGLIEGTYEVQPSDIASPASAIVIAVAGATAFGVVGVSVPGVSGQDILTPGIDYTAAAGQLTISASLNPPLQAGYLVHYGYGTGSAQQGGAGYTDAQIDALLAGKADAVAVGSGSVLKFDKDNEYPAIASGTFTVDTAVVAVGVTVRVRLEATASAPTLPAGFTRYGGPHVAGKTNLYAFCVAADGTIDYYIIQPA